MRSDAILNADMATIGRWLRDALGWWIEELAALAPDGWRARLDARARTAWFDGEALRHYRDGAPAEPIGPGRDQRRTLVLLPPESCLIRTLRRPAVGRRDLERMLALDGDRIMPMPAGTMLIAGRVIERGRSEGQMTVEVAGVPHDAMAALAARLTATGAIPSRIAVRGADGAPMFDFLPAMRRSGLVESDRSSARPWWAMVALGLVLNLALLVWRDGAAVDRLADLVEAQSPAVRSAQRIAQRVQRTDAIVRESIARRGHRDALGMLATVSTVLPQGAWVQRLTWDGATLRLVGYRNRDVNLVSALRGSPLFGEVRNTASDALAEVPAGQPYDLTARIRDR